MVCFSRSYYVAGRTTENNHKIHSPVFIEPSPALVIQMLGKDGLDWTQATRCLDVTHNANDNHGWSFNYCHSFNDFVFMTLCKSRK